MAVDNNWIASTGTALLAGFLFDSYFGIWIYLLFRISDLVIFLIIEYSFTILLTAHSDESREG
jgi:hypothetical protein